MANIGKAIRMAAQIFDVGENKIWIDPEKVKQASEAMTKEDIRALIKERVIKKIPETSQSRGRINKMKEKRKKGRKKGKGKRKGTKKSRISKKGRHMIIVRAQRKKLSELRKSNPELFKKVNYQNVYKRVKQGFFKGKKYLEAYLKEAS
ncbi:MAG TPA: 50S ribosomal protein L19e [archaeon]|nr:50S ribosomal protein L19e [archaeon]